MFLVNFVSQFEAPMMNMASTSWGAGRQGFAIQYDAVDDYIDTGLQTIIAEPVTVAFWNFVQTAAVSSAFGGRTFPDSFQAHVPWSDGVLYWDYGDATGTGRISVDYTPYLGRWTHVALRSSGSQNVFKSISLNGIVVASAATSQGAVNAYNMYIGSTSGVSAPFFHNGKIGDFGLWRRLLDDSEIRLLATGKSPLQRLSNYS